MPAISVFCHLENLPISDCGNGRAAGNQHPLCQWWIIQRYDFARRLHPNRDRELLRAWRVAWVVHVRPQSRLDDGVNSAGSEPGQFGEIRFNVGIGKIAKNLALPSN